MIGISEGARKYALAGLLLAGAALFASVVNRSYPVDHWLFWRYVGYWFGAVCWALSCLSFGHGLLARVFRGTLRKSEQFMLAAPLGAFAFGLSIFLVGLLHGLNVVTFFALPAALFAFGAKGLMADVEMLRLRLRFGAPRVSLWAAPALIFATAALGLLYIQTLHPAGFTFDARWYHLAIGQRYALSGKVGPFAEGFWNQAWPHLFSYHYAWAFLAPLPLIFDRLELCAHLEVMTFLMTLAQVPVMVRRLVPGVPVSLTWVLYLLFPGLYLYDSNLCAGADHFAAFFSLPIALSFWRAFRHWRIENVAIFATFSAAAVLTKYTALPVAIIPSTVLLARGAWLALQRRDAKVLYSLGALIGISLLLTAPNWLANIIWFGDPVYPMLHKYLHVHPWVEDTTSQLHLVHATNHPASLDLVGLSAAAQAVFTFSFVPHDWFDMHRDVPLFGSLFTLTTPCLALVSGARRVAWLYAMAMASVFLWFMINPYDRYLQVTLPWMVAGTACTLLLIWRQGGWARYAIAPLLVLQGAWGSDVPFIATHNLIGDSPLRHTAKFLASGFEGVRGRFRVYEPMPSIGELVPKKGVLLIHDVILALGTDRNWVSDLHQTRISYGLLVNPRAIDLELKDMQVTHVAWPNGSIYRDTLAGDLAFMNYAVNYTKNQKFVANFTVASLPERTPTDAPRDYDVAYFSCGSPYIDGMYHLSQLRLPVMDPGRRPSPISRLPTTEAALERADFVVIDRRCNANVHPDASFKWGTSRGESELWVRLRH